MVLNQLDSRLAKKIAAQDEKISALEVEKQERAAGLPLAVQSYDDAVEAIKARAKAFQASWAAKEEDERSLETTKKDQKDLGVNIKNLDKDLYKVEAEFDVFQEFARKACADAAMNETGKLASPVEQEAITA